MTEKIELDLIITLSHELGVALEMSYTPVELREVWGEAIEALQRTKGYLGERGIPVPAVIETTIKLAQG